MQQSLLACEQWAQREFSHGILGDCRRVRRLVKIAAALAAEPSGTLPAALGTWPELKAAYRLLDNPALTFDKILQPHWVQTQKSCSQPGHWLLIEDSTSLNFSSRTNLGGMGRIGDGRGRGLNLHTTLAFGVEKLDQERPQLSLVGLAGQQVWVRGDELKRGNVALGAEQKRRRFARARESERWGKTLATLPPPSQGCERVYIADRESDIYELFDRCDQARCDYVVRACQDRALIGADSALFETIAKQPELGFYTLALRGRPGTAARTATIALRGMRVMLRAPWRPGLKTLPRELMVVEAREINPPSSNRRIHWVILTSLEGGSFESARRVVKLYACRWIIEEYHKALKTGAGIEQSQLQEGARIQSLLAILALVAARLLSLKLEAASQPDGLSPARDLAPETLQVLDDKFGRPKEGWTQRNIWIGIARMGGYLARNSDGPPGWQTLWRGWQRLRLMVEGAQIVRRSCG